MTEICLQCGIGPGDHENMCETCFRERATPSTLPLVLKMKICTTCNFMVNIDTNQRIIEWKEGIDSLVEEATQVAPGGKLLGVEVDLDIRDDYLIFLNVTAEVMLSDLNFDDPHTSEVRIIYGVCNRCSRKSGNYYEAILQFRGGRRPPTEDELAYVVEYVNDRIEESNAENAFITSMGQVHKGLDFTLGDKTIAKDIARELKQHFGAAFSESFSIAGRRDGIDVFRSTFLIRLPDIRSGDIVRYRDAVFQVSKIRDKSFGILKLTTGIEQNVGERESGALKLIHGDEVEALVISSVEGEIQVLDPVNFNTVPVLAPRPLEAGETARFFRCEDGLFLLPEK